MPCDISTGALASRSPDHDVTVDGCDGAGVHHNISRVPYLPGLDGLRAVAVIAVMIYHADSDWLAGGYLGVEVFFVISGYLITLILIAEREQTGTLSLRRFWIRRFRRLLPALFLMMLLLVVWVALFKQDALGKLRGDVVAGTFYGANWYQIYSGAGYAAGNDFAPLRHLWSLAVEEQFYFVWPLVMILLLRRGTRRVATATGWLVGIAVAVSLITAFLAFTGSQRSPELSPDAYWFIGDRPISVPDSLFLSTLSRSSGLLLGAAFAMVWRPTAIMRGPLRAHGRSLDVVAGVGFGVLALMTVFVTFDPSIGVHGFLFNGGFFTAAVATLAILAAVTHRWAVTGRLLANPVLVWVGTRSYGLYLYHWPIYQVIRGVAAKELALHEFMFAVAATAVITELSYRYVETPIRRGQFGASIRRWRERFSTERQRRGLVVGGAAGALLVVFAGANLVTADLQRNPVEVSLEEGRAFVCDTPVDLDCDGVVDLDENGNPIESYRSDDPTIAVESVATAVDTRIGGIRGTVPLIGTTVAPTTTLPAPQRLAVGDSVMLGAAQQLDELGFTVDALESRAWVNGLTAIQTLRDQGRLPNTLVVHLGANGRIGQADMDRMIEAVTTVPEVVLVTNNVDRPYVSDNNALIYEAADTHPNVQVLDWQRLVASCPGDCLEADGFHLKLEGRAYYASLIAGALGLDPTPIPGNGFDDSTKTDGT